MTCRDCLHYDACLDNQTCGEFEFVTYVDYEDMKEWCGSFINKAEYRYIRFKTGDTVFWWEYPKLQSAKVIQFGGQEDRVWYTLATGKGKKVVVVNQNRLYATKEEAEQALKDRKEENK